MNKKLLIIGFIFSVWVMKTVAQTDYDALPWKMSTTYNSYLMRDVHQQFADRREELARALTSPKEMQRYQDACRKRYRGIMGDFPKEGPLNAWVVDTLRQVGFRVEKIIFESKLGRYVTANLYLPEKEGKHPAAIELCGHGLNGKAPLSSAAVLMARNGIAVMVVDPLGQGERIQLLDDLGKPSTRGVTTEHTLLNAGCNLVGTSLAAQEYWDNHRALDYLLTRSDIDGKRIGVYGSSGGGTQTAYMIGLDSRIQVAAICSFFSQRERVMELQGPSDGCQHVPYEGRERIEVADLALMMAPKPLLILSGKYDFVDLWGAQQGFKELVQAYTVLDANDKVDMLTVETGHGLGVEKQQRLLAWFRQWLNSDQKEVPPVPTGQVPSQELLCTPTGQVNTSCQKALSLPQENDRLFKYYEPARMAFAAQPKEARQKKVLELLGISVPHTTIRVAQTGHMEGREYQIYKYQLLREGEMPVPCVVLMPDKLSADKTVVLQLNESGKAGFMNEPENLLPFVAQGTILVAADLRGCGETIDPPAYNDAKYWNREYRNAMVSMHIGRPIMGQRVIDLMTVLDFITEQGRLKGYEIRVSANGLYGPVVIHAAFLDQRIKSAEISGSVKSLAEYLLNPMQRDVYSNVLYGVLKFYDLKDLMKLPQQSIRFVD